MRTLAINQGVGIHHPRFGRMLKEKMDALVIECRVETGVARNQGQDAKLTYEFIRKHLDN